jgi:hypothetical protein
MRLANAESLGISDSERGDPYKHVVVLHTFGDDPDAERIAKAQYRSEHLDRTLVHQYAADKAGKVSGCKSKGR